jgi:hypothetical protein
MDNFVKQPFFYYAILVGSVIGSILLSILANLLTPKADKLLSIFSDNRRNKTRKKRLIMMRKVLAYSSSDTRAIHAKIDAVFTMLTASLMVICGFALFYVASNFFAVKSTAGHLAAIFLSGFASGFMTMGCVLALIGGKQMATAEMAFKRSINNCSALRPKDVGDDKDKSEKLKKQDAWDRDFIGVTVEDLFVDLATNEKSTQS